MNKERIFCRKCKYFYVTWDVKFPNGCKLFGIKAKSVPSILVYQSTGEKCTHFIEKNKRINS
ncbi:uracil-DNA glycosylase [Crassaminicella profunda]|uniref:uracil-DNA glycosylase n=1 Tax=Crassaminicella profunda TaxID=1286698 RepID=UPI001CA6518E|nr:uracil-DNA glycosylase [Crassaminicella profunda]QZY55706.1 uracil-DNA glycosylase [Crassaminicella profunda]